jgi:integrase
LEYWWKEKNLGVSVREKPKNSGYWWLFIRHQGQRVCQFVSQQKAIAEDAAADIRKEIRTGKFDLEALKASRIMKEAQPAPPALPTLQEYFERFEREHLKLAVRKSTAALYTYVFNRHLLPTLVPENPELKASPLQPLGDFRLHEITRSHLKILVASLVEKQCSRIINETVTAPDGTVTTKKKTIHFTLSRPTLRIILSALTTCLTNAQREDGLIPTNPALSLGKFIKQAKPRHASIDPFEPHEVPLFLRAVQETAPDFLTMFVLLLHTGIRSGECGGLQWSDVDFRNRYLLIQRTRTPKGRLEAPKNGKTRRVDLSDAAIAALQSHRRELQEIYLKKGEPLPEWVFPNRDGRPHSMTNVRNRIFYRACEKAGLHRRPLHSTRHTFATLMLQQGESPVYVKEQMGHSSITLTINCYKHWVPSANRDAVNKLPGLIPVVNTSQMCAAD